MSAKLFAHQSAAIGFGVQLQEVLGLNGRPLATAGEAQNLCPVLGARGALAIHGYRRRRGVHDQVLAGQERCHRELGVRWQHAKERIHFGGPAIGGTQPLGKLGRRLVSEGIGNDDKHLVPHARA